MTEVSKTAAALVAEGKGILAADEGGETIASRFETFGIVSTIETQCLYREMLFLTPGIQNFISGVILFDDTMRQSSSDGTPFPQLLASRGIIPGVGVDKGTGPLALSGSETITEGLDGLGPRLEQYRELGAKFAKWRAAIAVGDGRPSDRCIRANVHALGRYAAECQEAGLVAVIEPDVLMDGAHTLSESAESTGRVLNALYSELADQHVDVRATLLKPNMVMSGYTANQRAGVEEVAEATLEVLYRYVPAAVPGIVFLSGGQTAEDATAHLNAMNKRGPHPWQLSFSYSRALSAGGTGKVAWQGRAGRGGAAYLLSPSNDEQCRTQWELFPRAGGKCT